MLLLTTILTAPHQVVLATQCARAWSGDQWADIANISKRPYFGSVYLIQTLQSVTAVWDSAHVLQWDDTWKPVHALVPGDVLAYKKPPPASFIKMPHSICTTSATLAQTWVREKRGTCVLENATPLRLRRLRNAPPCALDFVTQIKRFRGVDDWAVIPEGVEYVQVDVGGIVVKFY